MKQNKRFYERPHMQVVELKSRQTLLVGSSTPTRGIEEMDEEYLFNEE